MRLRPQSNATKAAILRNQGRNLMPSRYRPQIAPGNQASVCSCLRSAGNDPAAMIAVSPRGATTPLSCRTKSVQGVRAPQGAHTRGKRRAPVGRIWPLSGLLAARRWGKALAQACCPRRVGGA